MNRKVHVTRQTLDLLDGEYFYEPGTKSAKEDPLLVNNEIETYLISPQYYGDAQVSGFLTSFVSPNPRISSLFQHYTPDEVSRRFSTGIKKKIDRAAVGDRRKEQRLHNRKNFMQSSMEHYMQIMQQTNIEMARELDKMPIGKFQYGLHCQCFYEKMK